MRKPICAACGKEARVGSYCEEHWLDKQELFAAKDITIIQCNRCGNWFDNKWHPKAEITNAIKESVKESVKEKGDVQDLRVSITPKPGKYLVTILAKGSIPPAETPKEEEKTVTVVVRNKKCPDCIKMLGRYHEAVMQLRGGKVEILADMVASLAKGLDFRSEQKKEGYNLYFVKKGETRKIATVMRKKGFEVIESYKLVGKKDGKELWKDFYAIR